MKLKSTYLTLSTGFMLMFVVLFANGQIAFEDDFSNPNILINWSVWQGNTANSPNWSIDTSLGNFDRNCAVSRSWQTIPYQADNYLVSKHIDLSNWASNKLMLSYFWRNEGGPWVDDHYIRVMFTKPGSVQEIVDSSQVVSIIEGDGAGVWNRVELDFSNYIGRDSLYVIFHHVEFDQEALYIDDVMLAKPPKFDAVSVDVEVERFGFGTFGYVPAEHLPVFNYALTVTNDGEKNFQGFNTRLDLNNAQGTFSITNNSFIRPRDTVVSRGVFELARPNDGTSYYMDLNLSIDSTEDVQSNNDILDQFVITTTDIFQKGWYVRIDTQYFNYMNQDADGFFVDRVVYGLAADRYSNVNQLLSGPGGASVSKVLFGSVFSFNQQTNVKQVEVMIAPKATGQKTWVEIYNYDNALNTIGDAVEPIFVSDTIQVPFGYDDGNINMLVYDFEELGGIPLKNERAKKYLICVVEESNSEDKALGIIGFRDLESNWSSNHSAMHSVSYLENFEENVTLPFVNSLFFETQTGLINTTWPISIRVEDAVGFEEPLDASSFIKVYPNPTIGIAQVVIEAGFSPSTMTIKDATGRVVIANVGVNGERVITINAENLDSGIYFIELAEEGRKAIKKLVVR